MISASGVDFRMGGDKAFYVPSTAKTIKGIARDHLEGANGRPKVERWVPRWMRFPPDSYTNRGGVGSVAAALRAEPIEPEPEADKAAA